MNRHDVNESAETSRSTRTPHPSRVRWAAIGAACAVAIGGGSTITKDTPPGALSVARGKQVSIPNWKRPTKPKP